MRRFFALYLFYKCKHKMSIQAKINSNIFASFFFNVVLDFIPGEFSIIHGVESGAGKKMIGDKMSDKLAV